MYCKSPEKKRQKDINGEKVSLEVSANPVNVAQLKIISDVPSKDNVDEVGVELS